MTEQEWLTSTDPATMYAFVRDHITERQKQLFVDACRVADDKRIGSKYPWQGWGGAMLEGALHQWVSDPMGIDVASILREIIGNPFSDIRERLFVLRPLGMAVPSHGWKPRPKLLEWMHWNNSTVPNLIRSMMKEPISDTTEVRGKSAESLGYVPRDEPQWEMLPIIADALEEAGCTEAAILDHLRGTEPCPYCTDCKMDVSDLGTPFLASLTPEQRERGKRYFKQVYSCKGTGKRPVRHVRGCWAVELLAGGTQ